jgi:hypothetical protein
MANNKRNYMIVLTEQSGKICPYQFPVEKSKTMTYIRFDTEQAAKIDLQLVKQNTANNDWTILFVN